MTAQANDDTRGEKPELPDSPKEARVHLGERLSQARQAKGIGIRDASDRLRIRITYLEALESGDWSSLPEEVYVMGFLRQYTGLLGIDLSEEIAALKTGEYHLTKPFTMPDPPIAMNRTWAIVAGIAFLLLIIMFNVVDEGEKEHTPPVASLPLTTPAAPGNAAPPAAPQPKAAPTAPPATSEAGTAAPQTTAPTQPASPTPAAAGTTSTAPPAATNTAPAAATPSAATTTVTAANGKTTQAPEHGHHYELTAVNQDVWLQLHTPDGNLLKEALLRSGQSMRVDSDADYLLLTAGNPLALSIDIDHKPVITAGSLGEKDKVLHDYRLPPAPPADSSGH